MRPSNKSVSTFSSVLNLSVKIKACRVRPDIAYGRTYATAVETSKLLKKSEEGKAYNRSVKRFWEEANVKTTEDGHVIHLDTRPVRTASGNHLIVPKSKTALAHMIVQEWATLPSLAIKPHSLPLTSLVARAIDIGKDPNPETTRQKIVEALLPYIDTDTMLVFAPSHEYDGALRKAQEEAYRPVIAWAEREIFNGEKLSFLDGDKGLTGNPQPEAVKELAKQWASSLDDWKLTAFERAVLGSKSFLGGIQLVNRQTTTSELADAVTLEVIYQMKRWGEVEDSHDVDWADLRRQLASATVLLIED